eukprot:scaffold7374_cov112-Isochrysis_galbana.AAC.16
MTAADPPGAIVRCSTQKKRPSTPVAMRMPARPVALRDPVSRGCRRYGPHGSQAAPAAIGTIASYEAHSSTALSGNM